MNSNTPVPNHTSFRRLFKELPQSVLDYIHYLEEITQQQLLRIQEQETRIQEQETQIQEQGTQIQELERRVHELEARLSKTSSNSSKPPSSDGLRRKPKSLRGKSDKKPGGQHGRAGKGLAQVSNPDIMTTYAPSTCDGCGADLDDIEGACVEKRQVIDIPEPNLNVTEHRVEAKTCPCCGKVSRARFPENVRGPVQYGERIRALVAYFSHQHFIPVNRVCEIFEDIFGIGLSSGTCANIDEELFAHLEAFESSLKAYLLASRVLHFDETGIRCAKKLHWVHVASSQLATFYTMHAKRGQEGMDAAAILPAFQGIGVHDHWFPYFTYRQVKHSLCNAHHLRELTFIYEQEKEAWAKRMYDFLIFANRQVDAHFDRGAFPPETLWQLEQDYSEIVQEGLAYHASLPPLPRKKRGKQKQRPGKNLLDRLDNQRENILRFIHDFSVPFTNNQGERDMRMAKLKQKISGSFRVFEGGVIFCRIRSYISTARKQGWNIWGALAEAIRGSPRLLAIDQQSSFTQVRYVAL